MTSNPTNEPGDPATTWAVEMILHGEAEPALVGPWGGYRKPG